MPRGIKLLITINLNCGLFGDLFLLICFQHYWNILCVIRIRIKTLIVANRTNCYGHWGGSQYFNYFVAFRPDIWQITIVICYNLRDYWNCDIFPVKHCIRLRSQVVWKFAKWVLITLGWVIKARYITITAVPTSDWNGNCTMHKWVLWWRTGNLCYFNAEYFWWLSTVIAGILAAC